MKLLAIDTTTKVAGVALMEDGLLVCETNLVSGLRHSERLMPLVDDCLKLAGWQPAEIDLVAVVSGPGSFTGIRIGVAAAKGIAEALGRPVVAVNTLEALAASFQGFVGVVVPLLDARRAEVFYAVYDGSLNELAAPCVMKLADLLETPPVASAESIMFSGDGAMAYQEEIIRKLGDRAQFAPPHLMLQRAGAAAWLGFKKAQAGQATDAEALEPVYLRKSSAEQVKERKEAGHDR